jgi:hypothetical protein
VFEWRESSQKPPEITVHLARAQHGGLPASVAMFDFTGIISPPCHPGRQAAANYSNQAPGNQDQD